MPGKKEVIGEGLGIVGFTLGVLSVIFLNFTGILLGVIGAIFCYIQQKKSPTRLGKIGLILNIAGIVLGILFIIVYIKYLYPILSANQGALTSFPSI